MCTAPATGGQTQLQLINVSYHRGEKIFVGLATSHPSGSQNFEVAPRFFGSCAVLIQIKQRRILGRLYHELG
jgi:hypothetical protein